MYRGLREGSTPRARLPADDPTARECVRRRSRFVSARAVRGPGPAPHDERHQSDARDAVSDLCVIALAVTGRLREEERRNGVVDGPPRPDRGYGRRRDPFVQPACPEDAS